jgi:integrase/recombinase XerD
MLLSSLHAAHIRHLSSMRRSPATLIYYRYGLEPLTEFLKLKGLAADTDVITRAVLTEFQLWLRETRGLGPGGEHAVLRAIRATFRWALFEELIEKDPTLKIRMPTLPKERPPAVQPHEVAVCLKVAAELSQPLRNRALLLFLYDTGLRQGEVLQLEVDDLDLNTGQITVRGSTAKGGRGRTVPLGIKSARAIARYERHERKPALPMIRTLFLSRTGEPMTKGGLTHLLVKVAAAAGLPRDHVAPHAWRRGFAVGYLRNGGDMFSLQQILGHQTLDMTRRYVKYLPSDIQRQHLRASPADRL